MPRGKNKIWTFLKKLQNDIEYQNYIQRDQYLCKQDSKNTNQGAKQDYYCKIKDCKYQMYALKVNTSQKVHIYHICKHQHEHYASTPSSKRSLDQIKPFIDPHIERGMTKPLQLSQYIPEDMRDVVTPVQITNYVQRYKKSKNIKNSTPHGMNIHISI
jgi:hypothetical protein